MRRFQKLALLLFLFYTAFIIVAGFHSHSSQSLANGDCRLCQVSRTFLVASVTSSCVPQMEDLGILYQDSKVHIVSDSPTSCFGRAPPSV